MVKIYCPAPASVGEVQFAYGEDGQPVGLQGPNNTILPLGGGGGSGTNGTNGTNGVDGAPGSVWRNGAGAPSNAVGINGDYYLHNTNGDVYLRTAGVYAIVAKTCVTNRNDPEAGGTDVAVASGVSVGVAAAAVVTSITVSPPSRISIWSDGPWLVSVTEWVPTES